MTATCAWAEEGWVLNEHSFVPPVTAQLEPGRPFRLGGRTYERIRVQAHRWEPGWLLRGQRVELRFAADGRFLDLLPLPSPRAGRAPQPAGG